MSGVPTVSVVIPVYEKPAVLEVVLKYFAYQTLPSEQFEVIVVDDGSPQNIGAMLRKRSFPYAVSVLQQENRGRAAARNTGVRHAKGSTIVFCDADRIPDPTFIATHVAFHERWPRSAAVGIPWDCFFGFETIQNECVTTSIMRRFSRKPAYYSIFCKLLASEGCVSPIAWAGFLVGNSSVGRDELVRVGGFDEELTSWGIEHFDLALRLMKERIAVQYLHQGSNYHIPHPRNVDFFRSGIDEAVAVLSRKGSGEALPLLRSFLFGETSLQDFECAYCGSVSAQIACQEPIFFTQLRPTASVSLHCP